MKMSLEKTLFISDKCGKNALHLLLLKGHDIQKCIVDEILNQKDIAKRINDKTICGDTALYIAYTRRDDKFITQLLEKGANLEIKNKEGKTPIDLLHLNKKERLGFLSSRINLRPEVEYKDNLILYVEPEDKFEDVATVDKKIFNSNPKAIEAKMHKVNKTVAKEKKDTVLKDPKVSQVAKCGHSMQLDV